MDRNEVIELMESSKNIEEWNLNCDKVKHEYEGRYPGFWYEAVIMSGLKDKVLGDEGKLGIVFGA